MKEAKVRFLSQEKEMTHMQKCKGVDKDHRTSNWVLILYQTCTTIKTNIKLTALFYSISENITLIV